MNNEPKGVGLPAFDFRITMEQKAEIQKGLDRLNALEKMVEAGTAAGLDLGSLKDQIAQARAIIQTAQQASEQLG
jgi:hypothetical protein